MQEAIQQPTSSLEASDPRVASALRAEAWAGEPFLREGENLDEVLAEGTARRRALDEAIAEIDSGRKAPSPQWKVRYGLLLGLERVLAEPEPRTASGTLLRRHQVDALAGMLTELIAASQRYDEAAAQRKRKRPRGDGGRARAAAGRGRGRGLDARGRDRGRRASRGARAGRSRRRPPLPLPPSHRFGQDDRRGRVRRGGAHARRPDPHAPPPARLPVHARPDDGGLRRPVHGRDPARQPQREAGPAHDPDVCLVRAPRRLDRPRRVPARDLRRGAHGARGEDLGRDPLLPGAPLHRDDRDRAADREAGLRRLPRLGRRPAAAGRRAPRADRAAARPARPAGRRDQRGADRRRRLRPGDPRQDARPPGAQPGRRGHVPRPLRQHARHRLRRRRRPRLQPRARSSARPG